MSTNFLRGACTGTRSYQLCLDQSEVALKAGRASTNQKSPSKPVVHRNHPTLPRPIRSRPQSRSASTNQKSPSKPVVHRIHVTPGSGAA